MISTFAGIMFMLLMRLGRLVGTRRRGLKSEGFVKE
jgi:hypothetical protein